MKEKSVRVAVISKTEENEKKFIQLVSNLGENNIDFLQIVEKNISEKVRKSIEVSDKIIVLINSIDGVTPILSDIIDEIINQNVIPIFVFNKISDSNANISMAIEEVEHVLVVNNASDEQLDFPIVYVDDKKGTATLNFEEETENLNALYNTIRGK